MANSIDPDQTSPIGAVCSGSMLFASILNLSAMLCNYLQQTTSADDIYRCIIFLGALRVKYHFRLASVRSRLSSTMNETLVINITMKKTNAALH